jgi:hypothetical protein
VLPDQLPDEFFLLCLCPMMGLDLFFGLTKAAPVLISIFQPNNIG